MALFTPSLCRGTGEAVSYCATKFPNTIRRNLVQKSILKVVSGILSFIRKYSKNAFTPVVGVLTGENDNATKQVTSTKFCTHTVYVSNENFLTLTFLSFFKQVR